MSFLFDNIVAIQLAIVAAAFAWLGAGMNEIIDISLVAMPWLAAFLLELAICFPQRMTGESTYDARKRCWSEMRRDPVTWLIVAMIIIMVFPLMNTGLCPVCDCDLINFGVPKPDPDPALPFAPFTVCAFDKKEHLDHATVMMWFIPALIGVLAARHALMKRGKRLALEILVWNGMALAAFGLVEIVTGAKAPYWLDGKNAINGFFATFHYINQSGAYWTLLFGMAIALWRWKVDNQERHDAGRDVAPGAKAPHRIFWRKHLMLVPAVVFYCAALATKSRAAILFTTILAVLYYLHATISFSAKIESRSRRFKAIALSCLLPLSLAFVVKLCTSADTVCLRVDFTDISGTQISGYVGERGLFDENGTALPGYSVTRNMQGYRIVSPSEVVTAELAEGRVVNSDGDLVGSVKRRKMPRKETSLWDEVQRITVDDCLERIGGQYHTRVATELWKNNLLFGIGGWGYAHLCTSVMSDDEAKHLQLVGGANVHNDWLQFLCEHGLVFVASFVIMIVLVLKGPISVWRRLAQAARFVRGSRRLPSPVTLFALPAGAFALLMAPIMTTLHAFGDCPLRSPAVLTAYLMCFVCLDGFMPYLEEN